MDINSTRNNTINCYFFTIDVETCEEIALLISAAEKHFEKEFWNPENSAGFCRKCANGIVFHENRTRDVHIGRIGKIGPTC